jgi:hypothetical protein
MNRKILTHCLMLAGILFVILVASCFAAFTLSAANSRMADSQAYGEKCTKYYQGQTIATEILLNIYNTDGTISSKNGRSRFSTDAGIVNVTCIDGNVYFTVPITDSSGLYVDAQMSNNTLNITEENVVPVVEK